MASEIGRQPWIVYGLMRTPEGISPNVDAGQILFSIILFTMVYVLLFALFIFLLDRKIKHGPEEPDTEQGDTPDSLHRVNA
jgi:cytochrome d ubiquinol oxidase subunit I